MQAVVGAEPAGERGENEQAGEERTEGGYAGGHGTSVGKDADFEEVFVCFVLLRYASSMRV